MFTINLYGKIRCVSSRFAKLKSDLPCLTQCASNVSTSSTLNKNGVELERQAKMLNKLMSGSKRKWPSERDPVKKPGSSLTDLTTSNSRTANRRGIYNSILIRHISDLMSTGDLNSQFAGKGIEITGVRTTSDLSCAHIFYCCSINVNYEEIGGILNRHSITLRSQLSNLYILGKVPQLLFVRDAYYERKEIMENLFATADYGPPDEPQLPDQQVASTEEKDDVPSTDELTSEADVEQSLIYGERSYSKLKTNIYGLERQALMVKVKHEMGISKANCRPVEKDSSSGARRNVSSVELSNRSRVEKLADFIKQQKRTKQQLKTQQENVYKIDDGLANSTPYYHWQNEPDVIDESEEKNFQFEDEDFEVDVDHKK